MEESFLQLFQSMAAHWGSCVAQCSTCSSRRSSWLPRGLGNGLCPRGLVAGFRGSQLECTHTSASWFCWLAPCLLLLLGTVRACDILVRMLLPTWDLKRQVVLDAFAPFEQLSGSPVHVLCGVRANTPSCRVLCTLSPPVWTSQACMAGAYNAGLHPLALAWYVEPHPYSDGRAKAFVLSSLARVGTAVSREG